MLPCPRMKRWSALLILLLASSAPAKPDNSAEAARVLEQYFQGSLPLNATLNRIQFLGMQSYAADEVVFQLKRTADTRRRANLLEFLASLGVRDPDVEKAFFKYLGSTETGEVMSAARGLGRIKSASAVKPLIGLLSHQLQGIRREAARALGELGQPAATAPLLKAAKAEEDLDVRLLMITAAGRAGDKKQAPALEALLSDSSESTRLAAAQALCALGAPRCAQFAAKLLASKDKHERLQGVMLFEGAPAKTAAPTLAPLLKDTEDKVRARAARILVQGGDAKTLDWLVIESARAQGEARLLYEDELEKLRLTDEQRQAILKKAGLQ